MGGPREAPPSPHVLRSHPPAGRARAEGEVGALSVIVLSSISHRWMPDEEALLAQLLEEGEDYTEIALRLKRSLAAVRHPAGLLRALRIGDLRADQQGRGADWNVPEAAPPPWTQRHRSTGKASPRRGGFASHCAEDEAVGVRCQTSKTKAAQSQRRPGERGLKTK